MTLRLETAGAENRKANPHKNSKHISYSGVGGCLNKEEILIRYI